MNPELVFVALFSVAAFIAVLTRRLGVPYTVALVVAGLVLGGTQVFHAVHLTKSLLYTGLLPGLLFEASFHIDARRFWQNKFVVLGLAVPGVVGAIVLVGLCLLAAAKIPGAMPGMQWLDAVLVAALLVSTDPIAVIATFKHLGAPARLSVIMEGESMLNDGTSVVFVGIVLNAITSGHFLFGSAVGEFFRVVGLGVGVGALFGFVVSSVIRRLEDPMVEITMTTIAAWGSFAAAEQFHASGVIATVTAGLVCGNYAARTGMSPSTRLAVESFWEYIAFAFNSLVFLLIGLEVGLRELLRNWSAVVITWSAVMLARVVIVVLGWLFVRRTRERLPGSWIAMLSWGGLRGGLSMVLALALPATIVQRETWITITYGVVILSIFVQGLTMGPLLRWLKLAAGNTNAEYERDRARVLAARAARRALDENAVRDGIPPDVLEHLRANTDQEILVVESRLRATHASAEEVHQRQLRAAARHLIVARKDALTQAGRRGVIEQSAVRALIADLDADLATLDEGHLPDNLTVQPEEEDPAAESIVEGPNDNRSG